MTLTRDEYLALDELAREKNDEERIKWIGSRLWVKNSTTMEVIRSVKAALAMRDPLVVGERGICIYGPAHAGKSTALMQVGRATEHQLARRNPDYREEGIVPVIWIDAPPSATPKAIASAILRFFDIPFSPRGTSDSLLDQAARLTAKAHTQLIIIDEMQKLRLDGPSGDNAVNALKALMNGTPATLLFSGIDLRDRLASHAAQQIMRRCEEIEFKPFRASDPQERADFHDLIRAFSNELRLLDQESDYLMPHANLLMELSGGLIGPLRRVIAGATTRAILGKRGPEEAEEFTADDLRSAAKNLQRGHESTVVETGKRPRRRKRAA